MARINDANEPVVKIKFNNLQNIKLVLVYVGFNVYINIYALHK